MTPPERPDPIPLEHPEDSLEAHLVRHSRRSEAIYLTIVLLTVAALASLPLVRVGVSVQGTGIIRPSLEKQDLRTRAAGFVATTRIADGLDVRRGDELLRLRSLPLEARAELLRSRIEEGEIAVADLEALSSLADRTIDADSLRSRYRLEYLRYLGERRQREEELEHGRGDLVRIGQLAATDLVPRSDLENAELTVASAEGELSRVIQRYCAGWAEALAAERARLEDLRQELDLVVEEGSRLTLLAPETGTLEQVASISPGTFLQDGEPVAVLSPSADLIAEVFVAPRDIGLLRPTSEVRLLIDAFNHSEWGVLTGRVGRISDDYILADDRPMFRVAVLLDSTSLSLAPGIRGELRKGMTLRARFMVADRSVWALLRDDLSDWLSPLDRTR